MIYLIYLVLGGLAMPIVALVALAERRARPWPREGHGATYFSRPGLRQ